MDVRVAVIEFELKIVCVAEAVAAVEETITDDDDVVTFEGFAAENWHAE